MPVKSCLRSNWFCPRSYSIGSSRHSAEWLENPEPQRYMEQEKNIEPADGTNTAGTPTASVRGFRIFVVAGWSGMLRPESQPTTLPARPLRNLVRPVALYDISATWWIARRGSSHQFGDTPYYRACGRRIAAHYLPAWSRSNYWSGNALIADDGELPMSRSLLARLNGPRNRVNQQLASVKSDLMPFRAEVALGNDRRPKFKRK
jgi:hypothetical protein